MACTLYRWRPLVTTLSVSWYVQKLTHKKKELKQCITLNIQEVLFVHNYSGNMALPSALLISTCYTLFTCVTYYFTGKVPEADYSRAQCLCGISLFVFGEGLNFIHHHILSDLRRHGSTQYQVQNSPIYMT